MLGTSSSSYLRLGIWIIQPYVQKGLWLGICVIQPCVPTSRRLSKENSSPSPFEWKNLKTTVHCLHVSLGQCVETHISPPLNRHVKAHIFPTDLQNSRLSKVNVSHLYELHDRVVHDEDLEVTEIRSSSPSSTSTVAGASSISTVTGSCTGLTGLTTGLKPKSEAAPAICPLSARSSPANLSM